MGRFAVGVLVAAIFQAASASGEGWRGMPADFERQQCVLINWNSDSELFARTYAGILTEANRRADVYILVDDVSSYFRGRSVLSNYGVNLERTQFVLLPFDTIWIRDYGPVVCRTQSGRQLVVDADYEPQDRLRDNATPRELAATLGLPVVRAPITLDGGALLSNGKGLCLVSTEILLQNEHRLYDEASVERILKKFYGFDQVVFIPPLIDEPTGHLDMFLTFTSPDTIVVGRYDWDVDSDNAEYLDVVAQRLEELQTADGPLKVVRIPMPPNDDGVWRTYTNVLFINGALLVPSYPSCRDRRRERIALRTYQRLLPNWTVKRIHCDDLIQLGGGIHCVSMNVAESLLPNAKPRTVATNRLLVKSWDGTWQAEEVEESHFAEPIRRAAKSP